MTWELVILAVVVICWGLAALYALARSVMAGRDK